MVSFFAVVLFSSLHKECAQIMSLYWHCDWWDQRSTPAAQRFIRQKGNQSWQTQALYHSGMRKNHVKIWCKVCLNQSSVQRGERWFWLVEKKKIHWLVKESARIHEAQIYYICCHHWYGLDLCHNVEITCIQWTSKPGRRRVRMCGGKTEVRFWWNKDHYCRPCSQSWTYWLRWVERCSRMLGEQRFLNHSSIS